MSAQLTNRRLTLDADARVQKQNLLVVIASMYWMDDDIGPLWIVSMVLSSETKIPKQPQYSIKLFGETCAVEWLQMHGAHVEVVIPQNVKFIKEKSPLEIVIEALTRVYMICHQCSAEEIQISPGHITDYSPRNDSAP